MNDTPKLLDVVALLEAVPDHGLRRGQGGVGPACLRGGGQRRHWSDVRAAGAALRSVDRLALRTGAGGVSDGSIITDSAIGAAIRAARFSRGLTQSDLAAYLNLVSRGRRGTATRPAGARLRSRRLSTLHVCAANRSASSRPRSSRRSPSSLPYTQNAVTHS